jgi:hypothetical protein
MLVPKFWSSSVMSSFLAQSPTMQSASTSGWKRLMIAGGLAVSAHAGSLRGTMEEINVKAEESG